MNIQNDSDLQIRRHNYKNRIDSIVKTYNDARGLAHGFQKDAIQNAVGARAKDSWVGWRCEIELVQNENGIFLLVSDFGTEGLTGPNLSTNEIGNMTDKNMLFPIDWRLARISCDNVSGGKATGGGLFGIGKSLYSAASRDYKYYYESNSKEGYRCNLNDMNRMKPKALEEDAGRDYIKNNTGLVPITHKGTRIIICNPKDEIIDSIENGEMIGYIEETWWRIIPFLHGKDGIYLQGKKAQMPVYYTDYELNARDSYFKNTPYKIDEGFIVKRIGFYIKRELPEDYQGFYFYRKGMRIGKISLQDIPNALKDRYFGFIEVDNVWEDELAKIENTTHYDVEGIKKNCHPYARLRDHVRDVVHEKLLEWNYKKNTENRDNVLQALLNDVKEDIQSLFKNNGFEELGKGDSKSLYIVRLANIQYPHEDRTVYDDEIISFDYIIKSSFTTKKKFTIKIETISASKTFNEVLYNDLVEVEPCSSYSNSFSLQVNPSKAEKFSVNQLVLTIIPNGGSRLITPKKLIFYYGIDTVMNKESDFGLTLFHRDMPRISDKRVNSGESIRNIIYRISNATNQVISTVFTLSTHNADNNAERIEEVIRMKYVIDPCTDSLETIPFDLFFDPNKYDQKFLNKKGTIQLRARLIAGEDIGIIKKGNILKEYFFTIYYNRNEKKGTDDLFSVILEEDDSEMRRSWNSGGMNDRKIHINILHPQFKDLGEDEGMRYLYFSERVIKELLTIYLKEGINSAIDLDDATANGMSHSEIIERFNVKFEEMWFQKCQK